MKLRKEVKTFYGDVEVANAEALSHIADVSGAQMRHWLKDARYSDGRPQPVIVENSKSIYYNLNEVMQWLEPLIAKTRSRQLSGVGRPRSLRTPVTKQL